MGTGQIHQADSITSSGQIKRVGGADGRTRTAFLIAMGTRAETRSRRVEFMSPGKHP